MLKNLLCFIACMTTAICVHGQTTYKLTRVTSVEDGGMYVFEQSGRVMSNTIENFFLLTTANYKTKNITIADETYIWQLEKSGEYYKMKNLSRESSPYLSQDNKDKKYDLYWNISSKCVTWNFKPQDDGTFIIESVYDTNRYLSYNGANIATYNKYKAYVYDNGEHDPRTPGLITVYKLEEENSEDVVVTKVAGLATYVSDHDLNYSEVGGVKAYRALVTGNAISFVRVLKVPAGEGVLLRATEVFGEEEASKTFTIPITTGITAWSDDYNDFVRGNGGVIASESDGYYNYILNVVDTEVGFYRANNKTVASNRAYLRTTTAPAAITSGLSTP